ncbi:MAG: phenol hydroxylase [Gammaproteobacteria bacterium]|nr:phenol hydroxylase [Gammaproteobacteria bacterium]MCP5199638.1 phenol hydroxylase [Gammaproteobacteria bacterium]
MGKVSRLDTRNDAGAQAAPSFVRVTNPDRRGFVEFQFSIGDPRFYLEMTLPPAAFAAFCRQHGATPLGAAAARAVDAFENAWRDGRAHEDDPDVD